MNEHHITASFNIYFGAHLKACKEKVPSEYGFSGIKALLTRVDTKPQSMNEDPARASKRTVDKLCNHLVLRVSATTAPAKANKVTPKNVNSRDLVS